MKYLVRAIHWLRLARRRQDLDVTRARHLGLAWMNLGRADTAIDWRCEHHARRWLLVERLLERACVEGP